MTSGNPSGPELRRHPRTVTDVPVSFTLGEVVASESAYLNNISDGGAAFNAMVELAVGTVIMMHFPLGKPVLRAPARVVWCRKMGFHHAVGVEFLSQDQAFRKILVEAVRQIELYRAETAQAGRTLDGQQAALEWFQLYAGDFFKT
jgi:hypothetical protein